MLISYPKDDLASKTLALKIPFFFSLKYFFLFLLEYYGNSQLKQVQQMQNSFLFELENNIYHLKFQVLVLSKEEGDVFWRSVNVEK